MTRDSLLRERAGEASEVARYFALAARDILDVALTPGRRRARIAFGAIVQDPHP